MDMIPVVSGCIQSVGYDEDRRVMRLKFQSSGDSFDYYGVTPRTHYEFLASPSKGTFFRERLRDNAAIACVRAQ